MSDADLVKELRADLGNWTPDPSVDARHEAADRIEALAAEVERLRRYLNPYADDTEISGMSWSGFCLIGNKKSIAELQRIENRSSQIEVYRSAFEERMSAAEARAESAERALAEAVEIMRPFADLSTLYDDTVSDGWVSWIEFITDHAWPTNPECKAARDFITAQEKEKGK